MEQKSWLEQLSDTVEQVVTHFHLAVKNCMGEKSTFPKS